MATYQTDDVNLSYKREERKAQITRAAVRLVGTVLERKIPRNELSLITSARMGDKDSYEQLLKCSIAFIVTRVSPYYIKNYSPDDMLSEGILAFDKCLRDYDPSKGNKFITPLGNYIRNHMANVYGQYRIGNGITSPKGSHFPGKAAKDTPDWDSMKFVSINRESCAPGINGDYRFAKVFEIEDPVDWDSIDGLIDVNGLDHWYTEDTATIKDKDE